MASIFTKIIKGEIPGHIVAEDDQFIALLDIMPLAMGHTLVIPRREVDYIFDQDDATLGGVLIFSKKVAQAIRKVVPCKRVGVAVIGLEVPHTHIHLVPMNVIDDINFSRPKLKPDNHQLTLMSEKIRAAYQS